MHLYFVHRMRLCVFVSVYINVCICVFAVVYIVLGASILVTALTLAVYAWFYSVVYRAWKYMKWEQSVEINPASSKSAAAIAYPPPPYYQPQQQSHPAGVYVVGGLPSGGGGGCS